MTKKLRKLAMFTIVCVAVGAAVLTSCNKEEEVINNVPAMEMKVAPGATTITSAMEISWLHYVLEHYFSGEPYYREICLEERSKITCGISPQHLIATENTVILTSLVEDGIIKVLYIDNTNMSSEERQVFDAYLEDGEIEFREESLIEDPKLLSVVNNNYIPAGKFPIHMEANKYVITLSM
jgi:hypothetical protein